MKLINTVVVLMILVCGSQLSHGVKLDCKFKDQEFYLVGTFYSCVVTSLVNPHNNLTIEGYSGEHKANKNDADVKGISIQNTNTKYIPTYLGNFSNLTVLHMDNIQLIEINVKDFHGMQDLQYLSFYDNNLTSVPLDAFTTLTKLRFIYLSYNQIEELPNDIFKNNLELEQIYLQYNRIKNLGTEIFNSLKKLDVVHLRWNICVDKEYNGATEINQLKDDIKIKCKNLNEAPATTTTSKTTQNPTTTSTTQTSTTQAPTTISTTQAPTTTSTTQAPTTTSTTQAPTTTSTTQTPSTTTTQNKKMSDGIEFNVWIIILLSGLLIVTVLIFFYLKCKNRRTLKNFNNMLPSISYRRCSNDVNEELIMVNEIHFNDNQIIN